MRNGNRQRIACLERPRPQIIGLSKFKREQTIPIRNAFKRFPWQHAVFRRTNGLPMVASPGRKLITLSHRASFLPAPVQWMPALSLSS